MKWMLLGLTLNWLLLQALAADFTDLASLKFIRVCELDFTIEGVRKVHACSLCVNLHTDTSELINMPFVLDQSTSETCSFDGLDDIKGDCATSNVSWTASDDSEGYCTLRSLQSSAKNLGLESLMLTYGLQPAKGKIMEEDFEVPTFFMSTMFFNKLIHKGAFNSTKSTFISLISVSESSWFSWKGCSILFLASLAVINVLCAVFLQKYDIEFEVKKHRYHRTLRTTLIETPDREPGVAGCENQNNPRVDEANVVKDNSEAPSGGNDDEEEGIVNEGRRTKKSLCCSSSNGSSSENPGCLSSACSIIIALTIVATALLLVFLFHNIFWYVMVVVYSIFVCLAFSVFGSRLFERFTFALNLSTTRKCIIFIAQYLPGCLIGALLVAAWLFFLHKQWIWVLWDILSFSVCLHLLAQSKVPSFKWLTFFCIAFLVYDAFAVYITPLFMPSGKSIMEEAATGSDGSASGTADPSQFMPMLFIVEVTAMSKRSFCDSVSYSILGMGDVIIPGFLIVHASMFGLFKSHRSTYLYLIVSIIAYGVAFVCVFVSLSVMQSAQPALVFIVPLVLPSVLVTAAIRHEFHALMNCGPHLCIHQTEHVQVSSNDNDETCLPVNVNESISDAKEGD